MSSLVCTLANLAMQNQESQRQIKIESFTAVRSLTTSFMTRLTSRTLESCQNPIYRNQYWEDISANDKAQSITMQYKMMTVTVAALAGIAVAALDGGSSTPGHVHDHTVTVKTSTTYTWCPESSVWVPAEP
jgi:hypothetical protein